MMMMMMMMKSKQNQIPTKIKRNNIETNNAKTIANIFNNYLANIGSELACSITNTETSPVKYLKRQPKNSFYLFPTSATEIETEITNSKVNKSRGSFI